MKKYLLFLFMIMIVKYSDGQDGKLYGKGFSKKFFFTGASFITGQNQVDGASRPNGFLKHNLPDIIKERGKQMMTESERNLLGKSKGPSVLRFTFKVYGGYGFLTPGSYKVQSNNQVSYSTRDQNGVFMFRDTTIQTQSKKGIGGGFRFGGGIGFALNDFLSIGVDAEYQKGARVSNSLETTVDAYHYTTTNDEMNYRAITLTPHVIFRALAKPNYFIYNRLGIVFTLPFTLHTSGTSTNSNTAPYAWPPVTYDDTLNGYRLIQTASSEKNYKISAGIGFNVAFGVNFRLNNRWRIFGEVSGNFSGLTPSSSHFSSVTRVTDSLYIAEYDYSTGPPYPFLGYVNGGYKQLVYSTTNTTYIKGGETSATPIYSSSTGLLGIDSDGYVHWGDETAARDKKFPVNMNTIGINLGIIFRF